MKGIFLQAIVFATLLSVFAVGISQGARTAASLFTNEGSTIFLRTTGDVFGDNTNPIAGGEFTLLTIGTATISGTVAGDLNLAGNNIDDGGVIFLKEQAEADTDVAGSGQLWVDLATPNVLFFTDDAGTDTQLGAGGSDKVIAAMPHVGRTNGASLGGNNEGELEMNFANGANQSWDLQVKVPVGSTALNSIKVYYRRISTGDLFLKFFTVSQDLSAINLIVTDQTDALTANAGGGTDSKIESVTVPTAAFNALTVVADGIIGLRIFRNAADVSDTYEAVWNIHIVLFTFN